MKHITPISVAARPLPAASLLVTQQKAAIAGAVATAVNTAASAFNTYTQGTERKGT